MLFCLFLSSSLISGIEPAPTSLEKFPDLDFQTTYRRFFKIKNLIDQINIKRFEEFYGPVGPRSSHPPPASVPEVASDEDSEETLPEIDLTEEAILSQTVVVKVAEEVTVTPPLSEEEETTLAPTTTASLETALTTVAPQVSIEAETTSLGSLEAETPTSTEVDIRILEDEDPETNEVNTDLEQFISDETAAAAKKYGYKILLKKVGGKEVPVGKIKFSIPTIVEGEEEEEAVEDPTTTTAPLDMLDLRTNEEVTEAVMVSAPQPEAISAVVPSLDITDDTAVAEGVRKVAEEAELAVEEIKKQTTPVSKILAELVSLLTVLCRAR